MYTAYNSCFCILVLAICSITLIMAATEQDTLSVTSVTEHQQLRINLNKDEEDTSLFRRIDDTAIDEEEEQLINQLQDIAAVDDGNDEKANEDNFMIVENTDEENKEEDELVDQIELADDSDHYDENSLDNDEDNNEDSINDDDTEEDSDDSLTPEFPEFQNEDTAEFFEHLPQTEDDEDEEEEEEVSQEADEEDGELEEDEEDEQDEEDTKGSADMEDEFKEDTIDKDEVGNRLFSGTSRQGSKGSTADEINNMNLEGNKEDTAHDIDDSNSVDDGAEGIGSNSNTHHVGHIPWQRPATGADNSNFYQDIEYKDQIDNYQQKSSSNETTFTFWHILVVLCIIAIVYKSSLKRKSQSIMELPNSGTSWTKTEKDHLPLHNSKRNSFYKNEIKSS